MAAIILFDGKCKLCNYTVQFILRRDPHAIFTFVSLQSNLGRKLLEEFGIQNINSIVLIDNTTVYVKSSAAIKICKNLKGAWPVLYLFIIIPKQIRDHMYEIVAKHRYQWFGKANTCMLLTREEKKRFLD